MEEKNKIRIWCPTCGDITNGHEALDKICCDVFRNGFKTESYIDSERKLKNNS